MTHLLDMILAAPSLLYGCENQTLKHWNIRRLRTVEMIFLKYTTRYSLSTIEEMKAFKRT
jgi:hypothetical protein